MSDMEAVVRLVEALFGWNVDDELLGTWTRGGTTIAFRPDHEPEHAGMIIDRMLVSDAVLFHCEAAPTGGWMAYFGDSSVSVTVPHGRTWKHALTRAALAFKRPEWIKHIRNVPG